MKKIFVKLLSFVLVSLLLFGTSPIVEFAGFSLSDINGSFALKAKASDIAGTCGANLTWALNTETGVLNISGSGNMVNWSSYSQVPWYNYSSYIKTIIIGNSVLNIGTYSFYSYKNITSVTIGNSVTTIGEGAFQGCSGLTNITIPNSVLTIDDCAFMNCTKLTEIIIPDSVKSLGDSVFYECSLLSKVIIGNSVSSIGDSVFWNCVKLSEVTIGNSVKTLGKYVFYNCKILNSVIIPDSVTEVGTDLFDSCSGLTSVTIGNSVKTISRNMFENCKSLASVTIPNSVTSIDKKAFFYCDNLTSITIPNTVTSIGELAFDHCERLGDVYFNGSEAKWNRISVGDGNEELFLATIHFNESSYTVSYNANGGTGAPSSQTKSEDVTLTLSGVKPAKAYTVSYNTNGGNGSYSKKTVECAFKNWNTESDGRGTTYSSGGIYTANGDATLYAQWTNPTYGTLPTPTKSGYTFIGWYTASSGGTKVTGSSTVTQNITLYAHWGDVVPVKCNVETLPDKTVYNYKDVATTEGIVLIITYSDGTTKLVDDTDEMTFSGLSTDSTGKKNVTVTCDGVSAQFQITVKYTWWQWIIVILLFGWIWY